MMYQKFYDLEYLKFNWKHRGVAKWRFEISFGCDVLKWLIL